MTYKAFGKKSSQEYKCVKSTMKAIRCDKNKQIDSETINLFSDIQRANLVHVTLLEKVRKIGWNRVIDIALDVPIDYELWHKVEWTGDIEDGNYCCLKLKDAFQDSEHISTLLKLLLNTAY